MVDAMMYDLHSDDYRVVDVNQQTQGRFDSPYAALQFLRKSLLTGTQKAESWVVVDASGVVLAKAIDAVEST